MVNNGKNSICFGCGVCQVACPKKAIKIELSNEGFWVPIVDTQKCVDCGICDKVCAYLDNSFCVPVDRKSQCQAYAVTHRNKDIQNKATSGGAGFAIAQLLHQRGYYLVGVRYDLDKNIACHFVTDSIKEFEQTMNSKYIPSYTIDGFKDLMDGKKYAVFGTPCQIDSLRRLARLRKKENNFIFVDLFCHGVPSYLHWNAYLNYHLQEGERLINPIFRDKRNGWHEYTMSLQTNKRFISTKNQNNDFFQNIFFGNYTLNKTCYHCVYRNSRSAADLRMGDLWGGKYAHIEDGITGVLALTNRGESIMADLDKFCHVAIETENVVVAGQMHHDLPIPSARAKLLEGFMMKKSLPYLYFCYAKKMWIKNLVPYKVKCLIKNVIYKLNNR